MGVAWRHVKLFRKQEIPLGARRDCWEKGSGGEGQDVIASGMGVGASGPEGVEAMAEQEGVEVEDGGGARFGPKHAGLFETGAHDGLAAALDDPAADEPAVLAVGAVLHAGLMPLEEAQMFLDGVWNSRGEGPKSLGLSDDRGDAVAEQQPFPPGDLGLEVRNTQGFGQLLKSLAGMVKSRMVVLEPGVRGGVE